MKKDRFTRCSLKFRQQAKTRGFTLMEILVSISIIAVLVAIGIVSYSSINQRSRDARRKSDVEQLRAALELYRSENGYYPNVGSGAFVPISYLSATLVDEGYMPDLPNDPQDNVKNYYQVRMMNQGSDNEYYGYCLVALVEEVSSERNTCGLTIVLPVNTDGISYNYAVKNP